MNLRPFLSPCPHDFPQGQRPRAGPTTLPMALSDPIANDGEFAGAPRGNDLLKNISPMECSGNVLCLLCFFAR